MLECWTLKQLRCGSARRFDEIQNFSGSIHHMKIRGCYLLNLQNTETSIRTGHDQQIIMCRPDSFNHLSGMGVLRDFEDDLSPWSQVQIHTISRWVFTILRNNGFFVLPMTTQVVLTGHFRDPHDQNHDQERENRRDNEIEQFHVSQPVAELKNEPLASTVAS